MKKDLAIFHVVETVIALVLVMVLYHWVSTGALTTLGRSATGWYAHKVDGLFTINVKDTSIKLPQLGKSDLPIAVALKTNTNVTTLSGA